MYNGLSYKIICKTNNTTFSHKSNVTSTSNIDNNPYNFMIVRYKPNKPL